MPPVPLTRWVASFVPCLSRSSASVPQLVMFPTPVVYLPTDVQRKLYHIVRQEMWDQSENDIMKERQNGTGCAQGITLPNCGTNAMSRVRCIYRTLAAVASSHYVIGCCSCGKHVHLLWPSGPKWVANRITPNTYLQPVSPYMIHRNARALECRRRRTR